MLHFSSAKHKNFTILPWVVLSGRPVNHRCQRAASRDRLQASHGIVLVFDKDVRIHTDKVPRATNVCVLVFRCDFYFFGMRWERPILLSYI